MLKGVFMIGRARTPLAFVIAAAMPLAAMSLPVQAADLPQVKLSGKNKVPACATPGRLMGFLESRNRSIDPRFEKIAADYMRVGNELNIRWDIAFFQMMLETGNLTFKGDVSSKQNNFAGMGATGKHVPGESFADVSTGVKAHLQHLLLYAGEHLDDPVAERTRKVQEWGVLTEWQKTLNGPIDYTQLAKQWAPTSRHYARDIAALAESFYGSPCKGADPRPELLAYATTGNAPAKTGADANAARVQTASIEDPNKSTAKLSGADLARRAVEEARKSGSFVRSGLGGESLIETANVTPAVGEPEVADQTPTAFKIINAAAPSDDASSATDASGATADARGPADSAPVEAPAKKTSTKKIQTAALGAGTKASVTAGAATKSAITVPPAGVKPSCKVWTASYGGGHSVIIRARADHQDNYTVLDVNEGSEKREAEAYIAAYAKGGETVGEFSNPSQALDKAFELCPDG
ncbi:Mannosyl-glycoprotein endo-beta-N-acetylglucosaminidase [Hyphomicrobium facile]|uniref:Mannosyl-glycoprotein endo-beta-N-acetylglucosaminidase n=2 Tax=Hyphomicrobium facile TaxID=51670 RepID=A0A1I7NGW3_9HYPH|nr:Mannosyl-glycoprotein endo-beta-N-acetylglucosaminidase [Hyphomicrobium facile]